MSAIDAASSPFERIGGQPGVDRLVDAFYARMDALEEAQTIRAMHARDLAPTKFILKRYFGEWMGGPALYSEARGHPRLRMRHFGFAIDKSARDAWLLCMAQALEETVEERELQEYLFRAFANLADHMRNQPED